MRKYVLSFGEIIFNFIFVVALFIIPIFAVISGISVGGVAGVFIGVIQFLLSMGILLVISILVYSLLEIITLLKQKL